MTVVATAPARAEVDTGAMDSPDPGRLSPRRAALGWGLAVAGLSFLTIVLVNVDAGSSRISLATMLFLSLAVLVAIVGAVVVLLIYHAIFSRRRIGP